LAEESISSDFLLWTLPYTVYTPPGYHATAEPYPVLYFHDGDDYLTFGKAPVILDNLIASGQIPPTVAVFVSPAEREINYNCDDQYVRFFCEELLPDVARRYNVSADRTMRALIGPSLGGLISLYTGFQRPDLFGLLIAQSSTVRSVNGLDTFDARTAYARAPALPVRIDLVIGTYEDCFAVDRQGHCRDLLTPVRELHAVLTQAGIPHRYAEHHQGHSWGLWRDTLAAALSGMRDTE
jgi:enterochelin esterase family protein